MTDPNTATAQSPPYHPSTIATRSSIAQDPGVVRPLVQPLYQSAVYAFESADQVDAVYEGRAPGHVYYRMGTPNTSALESTVAQLEGATDAVAAASGMGGVSALLLGLMRSGDHVVADRHAYGGTYSLLSQELPPLGMDITFGDRAKPSD